MQKMKKRPKVGEGCHDIKQLHAQNIYFTSRIAPHPHPTSKMEFKFAKEF